MEIIVIGGGISGRLVQYVVPESQILDWGRPPGRKSKKLTRMFGANYLWESLPGIECSKFNVITHVDGREPTHETIRRYKEKIGKSFDEDNWDTQFQPIMTGYDIIDLPESDIRYECRVKEIFRDKKRLLLASGAQITYDILVSTIPLYAMLEMCHIEISRPFSYKPIYIRIEDRPLEAPYPVDTWYVNYLSDPDITPYRFTDRNGERHYEGLNAMGKIPTRKVIPGKIYPNDQVESAIEELRDNNIFCFGRFATWNPEELLHNTYAGIRHWATDCNLSINGEL
tara:strand:+ start:14315 stop:15166 length:852 start_codon:yes stop_codon:yes gene_type:complete